MPQFVSTQFDSVGDGQVKKTAQQTGGFAVRLVCCGFATCKQSQVGPLMSQKTPALALGTAKALQKPWVLSVKDAGVKHALKIL
ncbi:MAG: hypothetical protein EB128_06920 [Betaproteobacteria bacterium]|nr:hypothetical protein [Betaproteobacteria bacterium]